MKTFFISGVYLNLEEQETALASKVAEILKVEKSDINAMEIVKKSLDARRNMPPRFSYVLKTGLSSETQINFALPHGIQMREGDDTFGSPLITKIAPFRTPVVVIGAGPAGLFASYILALRGAPPILLERGSPVESRVNDVEAFWRKGRLDRQSNVFFGEGGAGTFSDGKLTNRARRSYASWVKGILVEMGAPPEIMTDAKPHIGTDRLRKVLINMRKRLIAMGSQIEFHAEVTDFIIRRGEIDGVMVNGRNTIKTHQVILAMGQNADDTYGKLFDRGVGMEAKPFAVGLRVEHPQTLINAIQYGKWRSHPQLPPAEYFMTASLPDIHRSVYTFCMCPGGSVIGCSSSPGTLITNGMSHYQRSGGFANSAIVVNVRADDFGAAANPLAGLNFRRVWEKKAFTAGGRDYSAPAQKITDFVNGKTRGDVGKTSYLPGIRHTSLARILPDVAAGALRRGILQFDNKMRGFFTQEAHLIGVETRTSSPVRICRGDDGQSLNVCGLYPCGEGAGYAGGIISSALDGIMAAQLVIQNATG